MYAEVFKIYTKIQPKVLWCPQKIVLNSFSAWRGLCVPIVHMETNFSKKKFIIYVQSDKYFVSVCESTNQVCLQRSWEICHRRMSQILQNHSLVCVECYQSFGLCCMIFHFCFVGSFCPKFPKGTNPSQVFERLVPVAFSI